MDGVMSAIDLPVSGWTAFYRFGDSMVRMGWLLGQVEAKERAADISRNIGRPCTLIPVFDWSILHPLLASHPWRRPARPQTVWTSKEAEERHRRRREAP